MALSILDGNQSATTLSTIVSSGQHIPSHTVVSLGSQAISNITSAISGTSVCVGNLGLLQSTVGTEGISANTNFIKIGGHTGTSTTGNIAHVSAVGAIRVDGSNYTQPVSLASVPTHGVTLASTTVTISSLPAISGTVTANVPAATSIESQFGALYGNNTDDLKQTAVPIGFNDLNDDKFYNVSNQHPLPIQGTVTIGSALPAGTNRIGVVTIGAGTVTIGAGTAQIGSVTASISNFPATQAVSLTTLPALVAGTAQIGAVTASISGTVPISISSVTVGNSVTIGSLPALAAGTAQIGSVTASISANPSGALTTRFGSVTTANTAQITTAVTNTSRKYLFAQNISIGSVTMGIGFSPTTTQGIQLSAGSGIVFDSFCPTGAVYWLGATTGAAWSILEG
jgi:hypothetical protein